jgi:hypothetical protein
VHPALVQQAMTGDEDAFASLMIVTGDRLLAIAFRILRDISDAEDAVQDAFVSGWRDLSSLRDPALFEPWLTKLLVRACYAQAKRSRRWSANIRELPVEGPTTSDTTLGVGERDQLDRAFRRLTAEQRVAQGTAVLSAPMPVIVGGVGGTAFDVVKLGDVQFGLATSPSDWGLGSAPAVSGSSSCGYTARRS